jgi:hypothetical protein
VASLAQSHADVTSAVAAANAARDAAVADLAQAQKDVDDLTAKLVAAATTPVEAVGLAAVAAAVAVPAAPAVAPVAPVVAPVVSPAVAAAVVALDAQPAPLAPAVAPAAPAAGTFLPGDP